jgi:hypothetical protein
MVRDGREIFVQVKAAGSLVLDDSDSETLSKRRVSDEAKGYQRSVREAGFKASSTQNVNQTRSRAPHKSSPF